MKDSALPELTRGVDWSNWAGTERVRLASLARVRSEAEVVPAVRRTGCQGQRVKAIGSGHSFTGVAVIDGVGLDLSALGCHDHRRHAR